MGLPEQQIRVVAADPIEVGDWRLLPSVLVNSISFHHPDLGWFRWRRLRPISIVVEHGDDAEWQEIPNVTANTLSVMAAIAAGVALISLIVVGLVRVLRGKG